MAKPRGSFERSNKIVKRLRFAYTKIKEIQIAAWSPDDEGEAPPEQVHLMVSVELPPPRSSPGEKPFVAHTFQITRHPGFPHRGDGSLPPPRLARRRAARPFRRAGAG